MDEIHNSFSRRLRVGGCRLYITTVPHIYVVSKTTQVMIRLKAQLSFLTYPHNSDTFHKVT